MSSGKSEIMHFDGLLLPKSCTVSAKKSTEELLMTLKIRNLVNFHQTTQKSENFTSMGSFGPKYKGLR